MNVGIHFSNAYWHPPTDDMHRRLALARPDTIKTCLFPETPDNRWDQVVVHRRLRQEHPDALIVARLFADMTGGQPWSVDEFVGRFVPRMREIMDAGVTPWFEIHNEPDIEKDGVPIEGWGRSSAAAEAFNVWLVTVIVALRQAVPGCKLVFPGQWVYPGFVYWWRRVIPAIRMCDAWGVHCYWQKGNFTALDWGKAYELAHSILPSMPIIVTEFGDSTPGRTPREKLERYALWYQELPRYVIGSAAFILGGIGWDKFEVTEEMALGIGQVPRLPAIPPQEEVVPHMFKLARPLASGVGRVSQWFGANPQMYEQFGMAGHNGLDYAVPVGTPILAAHGGVCTIGYDASGYGRWVRITEGDYRETIYAHLEAINVHSTRRVTVGEQIGTSGNTGFSTGPHLHFGLKFLHGRNPAYRDWVDPVPFRVK